jgi:hypothetical protein
MESRFQEILDSLPEKLPRSRLEPYLELVVELRRRGRTYRDITRILAEWCQVKVSVSTVHDFLRPHAGDRRAPGKSGTDGAAIELRPDQVRSKIEALRHRPPENRLASQKFQFEPGEPLRLKSTRMPDA